MARVFGIKKRLSELNTDERLAKEIIGNGNLVDVIVRMEKLLDPEVTYQILDSCACGTGIKDMKSIKEISAETLSDKIAKIASLGDFHSDWTIRLNQDQTITAGWMIEANGSYACECSAAVNNEMKVSDLSREGCSMPLTYCLCCAGHCRRHLQKLLNVQLKTKEVVSSPINSNGQKPCEFIFEIIPA